MNLLKSKKLILFLILFFALNLAGFFYKYQEWQVLNYFSTLYNETWSEELGLAEESTKTSNEFQKLLNADTEPEVADEKNVKQTEETPAAPDFSEYISSLKLLANQQEHYLKINKENKEKYEKHNFFSKIILGENGNFVRQLKEFQRNYYTEEIANSESTLALAYATINLYVLIDHYNLYNEFLVNVGDDPERLSNTYFDDILPLEIYTHSDFEFDNHEEIKRFYPEAYSALVKYKDLFGSFYAVAKDYAKGDIESAEYKGAAYFDKSWELDIDFATLIEDEEKKGNERSKIIIATVSKQIDLINKFQKNDLSYPFVGKLKDLKKDLVQCQLYGYKAGTVFADVKDELPEAKDPKGLIAELKSIAPRTDEIDSSFDLKSMKLSNSEDEFTITCIDSQDSRQFTYTILK